jgi:hypothetical protein
MNKERNYENKDLTLDRLCGEDHYVYVHVDKQNQVNVEVLDYHTEQTVYKESMHQLAWESLVRFSRAVLLNDQKIKKDLEKIDE